jgi:hypothetical protein
MFIEEKLYLRISRGHAEADGSEAMAERLRFDAASQTKKPYEKPTLQKVIVSAEEFSGEANSPRCGLHGWASLVVLGFDRQRGDE